MSLEPGEGIVGVGGLSEKGLVLVLWALLRFGDLGAASYTRMLAERGWFAENMERAREIGTVDAVSSTTMIDQTGEDVKPGNLLLDFQPPQSQCWELPSPHVESWRFESQRFEATEQEKVMEQEKAMAQDNAMQENALHLKDVQEKGMQEKALEERTANTQWGEESTKVRVKEFVQQPSVKEEIVEEAKEDRNVAKPTGIDVIDLDTFLDAEEPSSDLSMALVVVPDPEPEEILEHNIELAIVRGDNAETRETTSQSENVHNGSNDGSRFYSPTTTANELSVARQCPPGNGHVQAPETGDWVRPPRWPTSTVGILTVQCARCRKWRVVPSREKYEEIREHLLETPWVCENASEWRSDANCDHPTDLDPDSGSVWALDKPNLPSSPPGWSRKVVVRRDCSTRFADVYYIAPEGKTLRSSVEVARYVEENPGSVPPGTPLSHFSFTSPRPLPGVWAARKRNRTKALDTLPNSQEYKKAKTTQPLAKQLAQKLLHGTRPPSLPVSPSSPSFSAQSHPLPVGASFPAAPSLEPDLVEMVAMQSSSHPPPPNFSCAPNMPFFTSALPLRQCLPPRSLPMPQASSFPSRQGIATSDAGNPILGPAMAALWMKQQQQQQHQRRQRGAIPMSQPSSPPLRDLNGGVEVEP